MERLTIKRNKPSVNSQYEKKDKVWTADCIEKLGKYEDAEEQGLLLRLPCKVRDTVYYFKEYLSDREVQPYQITNLMISCNKKGEWTKKYSAMRLVSGKTIDDRLDFAFEEIGIKVFLTKAEAEQALAEMKGV